VSSDEFSEVLPLQLRPAAARSRCRIPPATARLQVRTLLGTADQHGLALRGTSLLLAPARPTLHPAIWLRSRMLLCFEGLSATLQLHSIPTYGELVNIYVAARQEET
jgi:hypothetical protein